MEEVKAVEEVGAAEQVYTALPFAKECPQCLSLPSSLFDSTLGIG